MRNTIGIILTTLGFVTCSLLSANALADDERISIYDLTDQWHDIANKPVSIGVGRGSWVLMAMVYTTCPNSCPMTISKMRKIESALSKANSNKVKYVLASFDPKKDRPEQLAKYGKSRGLDPEKWIFLSPPNEHVARTLAVVLGVNYKDLGDGDFSHSNTITLLNPDGVIVAKMDNLAAPIEPIITALTGGQKPPETGK